jgi:hypothetical protein
MSKFKFDAPSECLNSKTISNKGSGLDLSENVASTVVATAAEKKSNIRSPSIHSRTPSNVAD